MSKPAPVSLPLESRPIPPADRVELWLTDLSELPLDTGPAGDARKHRLVRRRIQQQFVLRLLLGSYLDCPGKSIELVRSERGKPALGGDRADSGLTFNLSHSGSWLAIVVGCDTPVGIDLEIDHRRPRSGDLAARFFSAREARWLREQDEPFLSRQFLNQWTAREALAKAIGQGLAGALAGIELDWQPPSIRALPASWPAPDQWTLLQPALASGLIGHVAAARPGVSLECFLLETG